ncbi:MAG: FMN-dependent NADH-azoreductase [Leucobacter sp.]
MPTLLRIDSSVSPESSVSRRLTGAFADAWERAGGTVVVRDLDAVKLPHLPYRGLHFPDRPDVPEDAPERALQDEVIQEIVDADAVVIGAPLYNYSMPSTLKAWLDYLHVPGRTSPGPSGHPVPLAGTPVVVISTRGADYNDPIHETEADHVVPALRLLLGTGMGMEVEAITLDRTLADLLPELDPALAERLFEEARDRAAARGRELASALGGGS